ncbi:UbiX family flavin prenyltransferase [Candidatus Bathyarchaeota archaeon]|nr:UbiX family flavin prenyltransferase [Candidatus Bathyarchaeota archaeon]
MRIVVGITGASGMIYAWRLLEVLREKKIESYVIMTHPAQKILRHELSLEPDEVYRLATEHFEVDDLTSPAASGSWIFDAMTIVPCSMASASAIACGLSKNLLLRVADICLKEGRPLIVVPRETPLNTIHLENLLRLSRAGALIIPACPAFYHNPQRIQDLVDFLVGRILQRLGVDHDLFRPWRSPPT